MRYSYSESRTRLLEMATQERVDLIENFLHTLDVR